MLAIYRFILSETEYEYEITILLSLVKIYNKLEGEDYEKMYP